MRNMNEKTQRKRNREEQQKRISENAGRGVMVLSLSPIYLSLVLSSSLPWFHQGTGTSLAENEVWL